MNKLEESYDAIRWFFRGLGFEKGILHISISGSAIMMDLSKSREDVLLGTIAQLTASLGCRGKKENFTNIDEVKMGKKGGVGTGTIVCCGISRIRLMAVRKLRR